MARICKGRTVFIIAHRLTTVRQCDRIIVMDKGCIVEQGDHESLIAHNGYYAKLYSYQSHNPNLHPVKPNQPNYAHTQQVRSKANNLTHSSVSKSQAEDKS